MGFNLNAWLDDLGITGDQRKPFEELLGKEEVSKKLQSQFLMQSDYTKKTTELASKQNEIEAQIQKKLTEIDQYEQGLVTWKGNADKVYEKKEAEVARLSQELEATKSAMSKIQTEYGIDPSQYVSQPANPVQVKTFDESVLGGYVKRDDFQKAVADAQQFPYVTAQLMDLNNEHYELFGKRLPKATDLVAEAIKQKKSLRDVWADQYKVEEKRTELAKKAHDDEIAQVRQETEMKVRSELKIPAQRPNASRPILLSDTMKARTPERGPAADQKRLDEVMAVYSSGKYAEGTGQ